MSEAAISLSSAESARFAKRIGRARADEGTDATALKQEFETKAVDLLILRVPAGVHAPARELAELGLQVTHADTLVYYAARLADWIDAPDSRCTSSISEAAPGEDRAIRAVARESFSGYSSHYRATPSLDPALVAEGYSEWAASYASGKSDHRLTYSIRCDGMVVGFVAASMDEKKRECDVTLNAVLPKYEGRGLYGEALGKVMRHAQRLGYETGTISTQIWNYRVQRVWTRCGMRLVRAYNTYHVAGSVGHSR